MIKQFLSFKIIMDLCGHSYWNVSVLLLLQAAEVDTPMLEGIGIATVPSGQTGNSDSRFEDIMQVNSSSERQTIEMGASSIFLYPPNIASNLLQETVKVTFAVYRMPVLFSSRYLNDFNMNQSLYGRRKRRSVIPNTRVISSSLFSGGEEIREFNHTNLQNRFRQYYQPLNVSLLHFL